jgi:4-hydroxy-3-polyprenylbenzoate decarboxylase
VPELKTRPTRIIVGITGATGAVLGIRILDELSSFGVQTHLCVSRWGRMTIEHETAETLASVRDRASYAYAPSAMGAAISSGSFPIDGMIVAPCSMRTLAAIAHGLGDNLIARAADVTLKERRKLVLVTRETPLNEAHIANMLAVTRMGAVVAPPVPAFYNHPSSIDDVVDHIVARTLDQFGLDAVGARRWTGDLLQPAVDPASTIRT